MVCLDAGRGVRGALRSIAEHSLGLRELDRVYQGLPSGLDPFAFIDAILQALRIRARVSRTDLLRVPETGPVVVVANHPYGAVEGMILPKVLRSRRSDVKVLANYLLGRIPELRELFLLVDPFERAESVRSNLAAMRGALRWLAQGGVLVTFPSGEVSHLDLGKRRVEDPPWNPLVAALVRSAQCPVVPVYFAGRNRALFQILGLVHPKLRTAMLARMLLGRRGTAIEARFGSPIPFRHLESLEDDRRRIAYLRSRTYVMAERSSPSGADGGTIQPRVTPRHARAVIAAPPAEVLAQEVARLPGDRLLVDGADQAVYVARAEQIPRLLREIGRLREITFREVGEGTGKAVDLDPFDPLYEHLFVWSRASHEVAGAYRIGRTDELIARSGLGGLYTSTLFRYAPALFETMGPALELGRSWIRPEYQKSYTGLLLLWKGIGQFVARNPRYATLFGPVSISADYQSASQRLIVSFLEQNKFAHEWSRWVRPFTPTRPGRPRSFPLNPAELRDLDEVSSFIAEIEADHKGVPILLKQYLKLGGRLLGFNVDPDFSNVLDVLIMVDLRQTERKTLERYMGKTGTATFLAAHPPAKIRAS